MMENIHSEASLLIDAYIKNEDEKLNFQAIDILNVKKADWAIKWINDKRSSFALD